MKNIPILFFLLLCFACSKKQNKEVASISLNDKYHNQEYRPLIHYSPDSAWMNDPNGMVYFEGEYHLFFQYYPDSTVWGPMHWGHAVSKDLVTWEHLPIGLFPDELGYIFSGSAVVDWNNTTGFQKGDSPPLVAIFTHHEPKGEKEEGNDLFQYQSIAYSNDKGRTWTKYEGNPVLPNPGIRDFRDPKVFWHQTSEKWVMILAVKDRIHLYGSPNLKNWEFLSEFGSDNGSHGGVWECPDLFELEIEGTKEKKWVMLLSIGSGGPNGGSATQYFVGDFDGINFIVSHKETKWLDFGRDNYAGVTWSDIPQSDGRRLFMGWMSNWQYAQVVPSQEWRSAMTLPRTLHLTDKGSIVISRPILELQSIEQEADMIIVNSEIVAKEVAPLSTPIKTQLTFDISTSSASKFGFELTNDQGEIYQYGYDKKRGILFSDRTRAGKHSFSEEFGKTLHISPFNPSSNLLTIEYYLDKSSIEVFVNDGERVFSELLFPSEPFNQASIFFTDGEVEVIALQNTPLKSIWSNQ